MVEPLTYLYIAYSLIWAGTFGYLLKLQFDYSKIKKDIELLTEVAADKKKGKKKK